MKATLIDGTARHGLRRLGIGRHGKGQGENGSSSQWFDHAIKDRDLATEARMVEQDDALSVQETRAQIRKLVESKYTAPAKSA